MKRVLLTGAGGFIGCHCVEYFLENTDWELVCIDSFRHKGTYRRIDEVIDNLDRVKLFRHDLAAPIDHQLENLILERDTQSEKPIDYIINMASESAVERSAHDPVPCLKNNFDLAVNMLEFARRVKPKKYIQISCYDEKTRVLTKTGFKNYSQIRKGEHILTLNPGTKKLEYKEIEDVIVQDYDGDMCHFLDSTVDLNVTPNHRIFYEDKKDKKIKIKEARKINTIPLKLPKGKWAGKRSDTTYVENVGKMNTFDLFHLCGLFIGDGFTAYQEKKVPNKTGLTKEEFLVKCRDPKTGRLVKTERTGSRKYSICKSYRIWFDIPENDAARKKLLGVLDRLKIKYTEQKNKSGEHVYFSSKEWLEFFKQFGHGARNKHIPAWMLEYDSDYLEKLLEGLIDSDGRRGSSITYSTSSEKLVRDCCELGIKLGYMPRFRKVVTDYFWEVENRRIKGEGYAITFCKIHRNLSRNKMQLVNYQGKIWCLKVKDNKNLIIERNGFVTVCGNTDEVMGEAKEGEAHKEWDTILPSNPYSASKAAQESLSIAYWRTYKLPIIITNTMNVIGERQDSEKFLPKIIQKIVAGEEVPIYTDNKGNIGSRVYLDAKNKADAIIFILEKLPVSLYSNGADRPDRYNICGYTELNNLELAQMVSNVMGKDLNYRLIKPDSLRPGYDKRYALDGSKLRNLGWKAPFKFENTLERIIKWTLDNPHWLV